MMAPADDTSLKFLLRDSEGTPFRKTTCWIKPEPGTIDSWSLHLEPPGGDAVPVTDLKRWLLFGHDEHRFISFTSRLSTRDVRRYSREVVLERYLHAIRAELPAARREGPLWCLIPGVGDHDRRRRYRLAIQRALPGARILSEPEMVVEYFRLVRRELTLSDGRSSIFLVVDVGALTCNFTFVLTRRDQKVVGGVTGVERKTSLRVKQGDAAQYAGRWVDEEIARSLNMDLVRHDPSLRADLLAVVEAAKLNVSRSGGPVRIEHAQLATAFTLHPDDLHRVGASLWSQLAPVYRGVADRLLHQILSGTDAEHFEPRLRAAGVQDVDGVQHIIDGILLAGGTSRLPGFDDAMRAHVFPDVSAPVHTVGDEYSVAASLGALAHVLHQHHRPTRLHASAGSAADEGVASATLQGMLPTDIAFTWRHDRPGERDQELVVLDRDDAFAEEGGVRGIEGLPPFEVADVLRARFVPGAEFSRAGVETRRLDVRSHPGRLQFAWNPSLQEARLQSPEVAGVSGVHLALAHLSTEGGPPVVGPRVREARLWTEGAPDIVVDLGMSKTVAVTADSGPFVNPIHGAPSQAHVEVRAAPVEAPLEARTSAPEFLPGEAADGEERAVAGDYEDLAPGTLPAPDDDLVARAAAPPSAPPTDAAPADVAGESFGAVLARALEPLRQNGFGATAADLAMLILALSVRPFVLLAGPPGSGKSTLVRLAARLLGLEENERFFDIIVQPHWRRERDIPDEARDAWEVTGRSDLKLFLFDEINLARPENYLMPFFRRLDTQVGGVGPLLACGTLNIDDASRPPSPKIVDRCLLLEIDAPETNATAHSAAGLRRMTFAPLPRLAPAPTQVHENHEQLSAVFDAIRRCVRRHNLRQDLLPSHRDAVDVVSLLATYRESELPSDLLAESDLIDRALAGRLLVKLSGAAEQVKPMVDELHELFTSIPYERCRRRLMLAKSQLELGFVSPWQ